MRALIVLTQSECKRVIARGLAKHPQVQSALEQGKTFIARGSTAAYVLEELLGEKVEKNHYIAGQVTGDKEKLFRFGGLSKEKRLAEIIIEKGEPREIEGSTVEELKKFTPDDVMIKGANTLGEDWIPGVYLAHPEAGTIGVILPIAIARGVPIIVPVSLTKRCSENIWDMSQILGNQTFDPDYVMGYPIGIMPIPGEVFTELDAFEMLYPDVNFYHIGSGGVGKAEGSLHFLLTGEEEAVKEAYNNIKQLIKTESEYEPDIE
ncbi:MAG: hypothetical protein ACTSQE_05715 [Candidatus Heimdallarchaeaceae archaeon]